MRFSPRRLQPGLRDRWQRRPRIDWSDWLEFLNPFNWLSMPDLPDCSMPDCDLGDCDPGGCDGCDGCDAGGCDLALLMLLVATMNYFTVAPVREGNLFARPALRLIRSYQKHVSAHRPAVCNLSPTCSAYGYETIRTRGLRGVVDVRRRLRACREAGRRA